MPQALPTTCLSLAQTSLMTDFPIKPFNDIVASPPGPAGIQQHYSITPLKFLASLCFPI